MRQIDGAARERAFRQELLSCAEGVYRLARVLTQDEHDAEELTQSTFLRALERWESYRPGTSCRSWAMAIARNLWIDWLRHRKVAREVAVVESELPARSDEPEATSGGKENLLESFSDTQVIRALEKLPEELRLTLFLMDVEGVTQEEAAAVTGVAVGTVKSRASRARARLREALAEYAREMNLTREKR